MMPTASAELPYRPGFEAGSRDLILPALREVLVAVCGGVNDCLAHYCDGTWSHHDSFVTIDDHEAGVHTVLRKGSAARRSSGSHVGVYAWPMRYGDVDHAEVWRRLGAAGLLPPEDMPRVFGLTGDLRPARRADAILFASLGTAAIAHVERMVRCVGYARARWTVERPEARWTGADTKIEARLARDLAALGIAFAGNSGEACLAIPPADCPPRRGPRSEPRLHNRRCPDPRHWRNRFGPSYVPARFSAGPCDADGRPCGREEAAT